MAGAADGLAAVVGVIRWHWWVIREGHRCGGGDAAKGAAERHPAAPHDFVIGVFGSLDGHGVEELVDGFKVAGAILSPGKVWVAWIAEASGVGCGVVAAADTGNAALACVVCVVGRDKADNELVVATLGVSLDVLPHYGLLV